MLKTMRGRMKIILWILILSFVLWGGSSAIFSGSKKRMNFTIMVFGKKVGQKEYDKNFNAVINQSKLNYGEKFDQLRQYLNLEQQTLDRIVLLRHAARKRLKTTNKEVIEALCKIPLFQDADGKFTPDIYKRVMKYYLKVPARQFEEELKDSLKIAKLRENTIKQVTLSDAQLKEAYKIKNEKINVDYALIKANDFRPKVEIEEAEINRYYQMHSEELRTPLRVNIEYIPFEYNQYLKDASVAEKEKELQKARERADDASSEVSYELAQTQQNANLALIAKKFGLPLKETGFFAMGEPIPGIGLSYEITTEAFKLETGQISPPIKTQKGRYIIKLKQKKEPYIPTLAEARPKISSLLTQEHAINLAEKKAAELSNAIKEKIDAGQTFKQACAELKLSVKSSGFFTKTGHIPGIGQNETFAHAAFAAQKEKLAGTAKLADGAAIIFVTERIAIDEEKFKLEAEEFRKTALEEKQTDYFREWFEKLKLEADIKIGY